MADDSKYGPPIVDPASGLPLPPPTDISGAATQTLPNPMDVAANAQQAMQAMASRYGATGSAMIPGASPAAPIMPRPPFKISPEGAIPQGPFGSVGERKRADRQAALTSISKIVQTAQDRIYQKKVDEFKHDFETLKNAIDGINQGKATGNQAMVDHNTDIVNKLIGTGSKRANELAKAFDVNLNPMAQQGKGGKQQKPNPAADGLAGAQTQWAKDDAAYRQGLSQGQHPLTPQAQALMRGMPQTLQPNPQFEAYLQAIEKGAIPKAGEELTFYKGLMDVQEKINNNQVTNATKAQIAQNLVKAMENRTYMQQYGAILRTQMQQLGAGERAEIMANAMKYRADQALKGTMEHNKVLSEHLGRSSDPENAKMKTYIDGLYKQAEKNSKDQEDAKKAGNKKRLETLQKESDEIQFKMAMANELAARRLQFGPDQLQQTPQFYGMSDEEFILYQQALQDAVTPTPSEQP